MEISKTEKTIVNDLEVVNGIFLKFSLFFGHKWTKQFENDTEGEFEELMMQEWLEEISDIPKVLLKLALAECRSSLIWPPSVAEFRNICERYAGLPDAHQIMFCVRYERFDHPLVKLVFDRVGPEVFRKSHEDVVLKRVQGVYQECLAQLRNSNQIYLTSGQLKLV